MEKIESEMLDLQTKLDRTKACKCRSTLFEACGITQVYAKNNVTEPHHNLYNLGALGIHSNISLLYKTSHPFNKFKAEGSFLNKRTEFCT